MASLTIRDDLAQQFQEFARQNGSTLDEIFEELLALYQTMNPQIILPAVAQNPDSEAYIGSLGSMCSVGEGDLSALSVDVRQSILDNRQKSDDDSAQQ